MGPTVLRDLLGSTELMAPAEDPCPVCLETFETLRDKHSHQISKGHFRCKVCKHEFFSAKSHEVHIRMAHPPKQQLYCYACEKDFTQAADFLAHLEKNECRLYTLENLKRLQHSRDTGGPVTTPPERFESNARATETAGKSPKMVYKEAVNIFSQHSARVNTQPNTRQRALTSTKLTPKYNTVPPPPSLLPNGIARPSSGVSDGSPATEAMKEQPSDAIIVDPDDPGFCVAPFLMPLLDMYKCPHGCKKGKFSTGRALVAHLRSVPHGQSFRCRMCSRKFTTRASLLKHMESTVVQCAIQVSPAVFDEQLADLSFGLLQVHSFIECKDLEELDHIEQLGPIFHVNLQAPAQLLELQQGRLTRPNYNPIRTQLSTNAQTEASSIDRPLPSTKLQAESGPVDWRQDDKQQSEPSIWFQHIDDGIMQRFEKDEVKSKEYNFQEMLDSNRERGRNWVSSINDREKPARKTELDQLDQEMQKLWNWQGFKDGN